MASLRPIPRGGIARVSKIVTRDRYSLSMVRCTPCREAKQKCLPIDREWPLKCDRCMKRGLPCSEPRRAIRKQRKETTLEIDALESSLSSENDLDIFITNPKMCESMGDLIEVTLIHKNIQLALDWLTERGQDLSKLFPTCYVDFITNTPNIEGELKEVLLITGSIINNKLRDLIALGDSLGGGKISAKLPLWRAFQLGKRECEICGTMNGVSLLGPGLEETVLEGKNFSQAILASRRLCGRHKLELGWNILHFTEWSRGNGYECMKSHGILDLLPPMARTTPSYIPDSIIESTPSNLLGLTFGDLLSPCDLLGRTLLHQLLELNEPCYETALENIIRTGSRSPFEYNQQDCLGRTPLHIACQKGSTSMVYQLLQVGAYPTIPTHAGFLPVHFAAAKGSVDICQMLRSHSNVSNRMRGPDGRAAKHYALLNNHFAVAKIMSVEYDPIRTVPTQNLDLPLLRAIMQESVTGVREALTAGANPNALFDPTFSGEKRFRSALLIALQENWDWPIAETLRDAGADLNARMEKDETALHVCVRNDDWSGVRWLLDNGADILAADGKGRTAIMLAAKIERMESLETLIDYARKASKLSDVLNAKDREGRTASDYAFWHRNTHGSRLIKGPRWNKPDQDNCLTTQLASVGARWDKYIYKLLEDQRCLYCLRI